MGTRPVSWTKFGVIIAIAITAAACTTSASPGASTGGGGGSAGPSVSSGGGPSASTGGGPSASGGVTATGSLTTSGLYDATWSWTAGNAADVGDLGSITLNSDKGTFGNISVMHDGSIRFGSGASELSAGTDFTGSGAQVTLNTKGPVPGTYVCGFKLDNDLTGHDGSTLHIKGTMTLHSDDSITPC
jgi:hypothetical protein